MPPKRKAAAAVEENAATDNAAASPAKQAKKAPSGRGRGRPPLSAEEKAKRAAEKANKPPGARGRPKGSTKISRSEVTNTVIKLEEDQSESQMELLDERTQRENLFRSAMLNRCTTNQDLLNVDQEKSLSHTPAPTEDQFDSFAKTMAYKLRNLPREQRIFAEKMCFEAVMEAEFGNLTKQSKILTWSHERDIQPPSQSQSSIDNEAYCSHDYKF